MRMNVRAAHSSSMCKPKYEYENYSQYDHHDFSLLLQDVCSALVNGFNHTLLSMGQTQLGKSTCLFGKFAWSASRMKGPCCVLISILRRLLAHASSEQGQVQLALSCWETCCDQVSLLCDP